MFYTKKDGAKYFILGKMSSGRQKKFCIKKKGEYINMKASPYKPVQARIRRTRCSVQAPYKHRRTSEGLVRTTPFFYKTQ